MKITRNTDDRHQKSSLLLRKPIIDHKFIEPYFIDHEKMLHLRGDAMPRSLYEHANRLEENRVFDAGNKDLKSIETEIKISSKITANEVFKRGELFCVAKALCQQQNKEFKPWVEATFDFGYETALNSMHVFTYCLGWRSVAVNVPPSILYKVASPSFPEALRAWLFEGGKIDTLTNGECKKMVQKFKEGGVEAIEADVEQMNKNLYAYRQVKYTIDLCKSYFVHTEELKVKIQNRGERRPTMYFEDRFKFFEPVASEISNKLWMTIKRCSEDVEMAITESIKKLDEEWEAVRNSDGNVT